MAPSCPGPRARQRRSARCRRASCASRLAPPSPPDPDDLATDPVVAAAWQYTEAAGPVRPGEHIGVSRFSVYPERYQVPSRVIDLSSSRGQAAARARGRAYGFAVWRDAEARALLRRAVDDLGADPRGVRAREALTAGYFSGAPTREAASATACGTRNSTAPANDSADGETVLAVGAPRATMWSSL
ncbi:hypothetical protein [Streptacidiphilus neutrinimicus]|uniref:hypothetical protein n=1 Tax=Streptacidiphilus neutrinimicus TaxID=105420 RepID=UPI0005A9E0C1|nr:hypothetical protein [Streptacidiphilus neutrinimicus]